MGNAPARPVFGGRLSEFFEEDEAQPIPLVINVCLNYLAHVRLTRNLETRGLEKAVQSVGFANDDDDPDGLGLGSGRSTPMRTPSRGGTPNRRPSFMPLTPLSIRTPTRGRSNSLAASPMPSRRTTSKTMTMVRPEKALRTVLRQTKRAVNNGACMCACVRACVRACDFFLKRMLDGFRFRFRFRSSSVFRHVH